MLLLWLTLWAVVSCAYADDFGLVLDPKSASTSTTASTVYKLDLTGLFNNRGLGMSPGDANLDGWTDGLPAQYLPSSNPSFNGVEFTAPRYQASGNDNVVALGQNLTVPTNNYISLHILAAAESNIATADFIASYSDGSTETTTALIDQAFQNEYPNGGALIFPFYYDSHSIHQYRSMIFDVSIRLNPNKSLRSITLPNLGNTSWQQGGNRLHIYAASLLPSNGAVTPQIQFARSTQLWFEGTNKVQIFEVTINNAASRMISVRDNVRVVVTGTGIKTVAPGIINRLGPGDQVVVQVGIQNTGGTPDGTPGNAGALIK